MFRKKGAFVGVLVAAATMAAGAMAVTAGELPEAAQALPEDGIDRIPALAGEMFGRYLLPFEAISILLLATAVAVVVLAKRDRKDAPRKGA
jgi:NADH:ubiquinone oxidoreductase subunit 6 (subunit J)